MVRLPTVGGDTGSWGTILNEFLQQSHNTDGTLKSASVDTSQLKASSVTNVVLADNSVSEAKLSNELQAKLNAPIANESIEPEKLAKLGEPNGVASLDASGTLPEEQLPERLSSSELQNTITQQAVPRNDWADQVMDALGTLAPPLSTPTIAWSAGLTTAMSSPVEYRPSICGTGSQTTNWDGRNDPNFRYFSGVFNTENGANRDLALYGSLKPGGAAQAAVWPVVVEFTTSAGVDQFELGMWGATSPSFRLEVNGQPAIGDYILHGPSNLGNAKKALFTFQDARARRIRLYFAGSIGFHSIRVPTGQSISKPTDTIRRGAIIGDSFVNGAGSIADFPAGTSLFDTWALRVMKALGCNDIILAGIGSTGFVATNPTSHYQQRLSTVLGFAPDVLIATGSINDGSAGTGVEAAATSFFAASTSVSERYAIGVPRGNYDGNHAALEAAATAAGVPFISMHNFLFGTGRVTAPNGSGNADIFIMNDGAHPTFAGHRALEQAIWRQISALR